MMMQAFRKPWRENKRKIFAQILLGKLQCHLAALRHALKYSTSKLNQIVGWSLCWRTMHCFEKWTCINNRLAKVNKNVFLEGNFTLYLDYQERRRGCCSFCTTTFCFFESCYTRWWVEARQPFQTSGTAEKGKVVEVICISNFKNVGDLISLLAKANDW